MTKEPVLPRVVIDTDTANEVDDQFALAWALRAGDRIQLEGVHAAPFSHGRYFEALRRASTERGDPHSDFDHIAISMDPDKLKALIEPNPPGLATERRLIEIHRVFEAAKIPCGGLVRSGSMTFRPDAQTTVPIDAVDHLIELAHSASPEVPIHVAAIAAPTNVASALLTDPTIAPNLQVLFLAKFPSGAESAGRSRRSQLGSLGNYRCRMASESNLGANSRGSACERGTGSSLAPSRPRGGRYAQGLSREARCHL